MFANEIMPRIKGWPLPDPRVSPVIAPQVVLAHEQRVVLPEDAQSGEGGPRAVGARPSSATAGFCCVLTLFEYFTQFPGKRDTLALTAHGARGVP